MSWRSCTDGQVKIPCKRFDMCMSLSCRFNTKPIIILYISSESTQLNTEINWKVYLFWYNIRLANSEKGI